MQHLSNKSRDSLYDAVHNAVMDARVKIESLVIKDEYAKQQLDNILFTLTIHAPQAAIDCFTYNKDQ